MGDVTPCRMPQQRLFRCRFNAAVFEGRLPADLDIGWNTRLKTTAGTTHFRRDPPVTLAGPPRWGPCLSSAPRVAPLVTLFMACSQQPPTLVPASPQAAGTLIQVARDSW